MRRVDSQGRVAQSVQLESYRQMEMLTREIMNRLLNKLWYAGLVLTLMLPDVCGALESKDGKSFARALQGMVRRVSREKIPSRHSKFGRDVLSPV
jgi:hypothetical protein